VADPLRDLHDSPLYATFPHCQPLATAPLASGYAVTGLFLDVEELAARLLRRI
jgi:hypothetical protein